MTQNLRPERLRHFIDRLAELLDQQPDEPALLDRGQQLLAELVSHDDWLPDDLAQPDPQRYQQYLLHCDSRQRFSVVSFVWGPGQQTPVHDHRVWGLIGMLRGAAVDEMAQALRAQVLGHGSGSAFGFRSTLANPISILKMQNNHKLICK